MDHAAVPAEGARKQDRDDVTTQVHEMVEGTAAVVLLGLEPAIQEVVPSMVIGEVGVAMDHAALPAEVARKEEQDNVTTHAQEMVEETAAVVLLSLQPAIHKVVHKMNVKTSPRTATPSLGPVTPNASDGGTKRTVQILAGNVGET